MSEEIGKKVQAVVDRVNQAVSRRPKVSFSSLSLKLCLRTQKGLKCP